MQEEISAAIKKPTFWLENFFVKSERAIYLTHWVNYTERANLTVRRLIKDDKFIIEFKYYNFKGDIEDVKLEALINNKRVMFNK
ncbi:hypothetical protein [Mycoplasma phocoeninasale]|uniref:hypothetical protein n=1 Tax=Mycoplasma phocoeninasale TaxID=2726117 RepID=UPI001967E130|nr:hypothetical protein [Mycoplasma phocoeninasale]MBN0970822.1 hypothetical protein [Mycoplasma phocoeninasale]